jgi:putative ABC transport system permease protein
MGFEAAELEQREVGDLLLIPEKNAELKVVGVLKRTGTQDDGTIFLPLNTLQNVFGMSKKLTGVGIQVDKETDMAKFEEKLYDLPDVQVVSLSQVKSTIMSLVTTAKMMVISIAVIAILIAMIGVINTILMSVFERFQEIGILKSMGAMPGDIFKMIWIETVILCGAGGLIGNLIALALAEATDFMVRNVLPYAPEGKLVEIDAPLFIFNTLLIIGIGIVSGIYPALKAAKVRPIETIRGEAK